MSAFPSPLFPTLWSQSQLTPSQPQSLYPLAAGLIVAGLIVGLILMWLILRVKISSLRVRQEEQARSSRKQVAELEAGASLLEAELSELRSTESILLKRQGELEANISGHKRRHTEQESLLSDIEERLSKNFRAMSDDALKGSREQFLVLAQEALKDQQTEAQGAFDKRHLAVEELIRPVAQSLEKVQSRVGEIEAARESAYGTLLDQVRELAVSQASLNQETHKLSRALRQPSGRVQWGEIQLKRCVEMAGMEKYCEFLPTSETQGAQPDLIVRLPDNQQVIVDAKAPMSSYLDALESEDDARGETLLQQHAREVAAHIDRLSSTDYLSKFATKPEFVVLFLPSESFFSAALNQDPALIEKGVDQGVILATPTTLIALLRAIGYGWRQENLAENARQIAKLGGELYQRLSGMTEHFGRLGQSLKQTVTTYNQAMSSLESQVLPGAKRFEELGAPESSQPFGSIPHIDITPHSLGEGSIEAGFLAEPIPTQSSRPAVDNPDASEERFEGFLAEEDEAPESGQKANAAADDLRAALKK